MRIALGLNAVGQQVVDPDCIQIVDLNVEKSAFGGMAPNVVTAEWVNYLLTVSRQLCDSGDISDSTRKDLRYTALDFRIGDMDWALSDACARHESGTAIQYHFMTYGGTWQVWIMEVPS